MKNYRIFVTISALVLGIVSGCSKDDEALNRPPNEFALNQFLSFDGTVSMTPDFRWNEAVDPDGDKVTYDLYVLPVEFEFTADTEPFANDIESTNFQTPPEMSLADAVEYHWRVLAKDGNGGETWSNTLTFETTF